MDADALAGWYPSAAVTKSNESYATEETCEISSIDKLKEECSKNIVRIVHCAKGNKQVY